MSVKIGQFRRNQQNQSFFQTKISKEKIHEGCFKIKNKQGVEFREFCLFLKNESDVTINFKEGQTYYIEGNIRNAFKEIGGADTVVVKLYADDNQQKIIGKFSTATLGFSFTPNQKNYKYLVFAIENPSFELRDDQLPTNTNYSMYELSNVVTKIGKVKLKKIGIQGPPGLKFSVNEEDFTMGKTGIFTLSDIDITQISFHIKAYPGPEVGDIEDIKINYINYFPHIFDGYEFFIMDYEYEEA